MADKLKGENTVHEDTLIITLGITTTKEIIAYMERDRARMLKGIKENNL